MKLWLVSRTDPIGYDEYDSMVVAAETEEEAQGVYFEARRKLGGL